MKLLAVFCLIFSASVFADSIYKSVDEEGNVVFTDKPIKGAKEIKLRKAQSIAAPETKPFKYTPAQKKEKKDEYTKLLITSPVNDSTIHSNDGKLTVAVSLEPALNEKDQLVLYLDGQQVSTGKATQFSLSGIERGTHNLSVGVMTDGKILQRSNAVVFYLRKVSVLSPTNKSKSAQQDTAPAVPAPTL